LLSGRDPGGDTILQPTILQAPIVPHVADDLSDQSRGAIHRFTVYKNGLEVQGTIGMIRRIKKGQGNQCEMRNLGIFGFSFTKSKGNLSFL